MEEEVQKWGLDWPESLEAARKAIPPSAHPTELRMGGKKDECGESGSRLDSSFYGKRLPSHFTFTVLGNVGTAGRGGRELRSP